MVMGSTNLTPVNRVRRLMKMADGLFLSLRISVALLPLPQDIFLSLLPPLTAVNNRLTNDGYIHLPVSAFYGEQKESEWTLHMEDNFGGVTGTYADWGIEIMYR
tara:strand:+ start:5428 stop:5739 length:312 start_codon:yes stop_codon:yes gene_type:complete